MSLLPTPRRVPSSASLSGGTPQRRSHHDLQLLINELFEQRETIQQGEDGSRKCQCRELPHLVRAFQERRNLTILQDEEFESLESFAEQHPEVYVSSEDLVGLLTAITPNNSNSADPPESPTAKYANKTLPTSPPSSGDSDTEDVPSRGRSNSASSGSSRSSRGSNVLTGTGTLEGADPDELVFPRSFSMPEHLVSPPSTPIHSSSFINNPRKKTNSDPDKPDLKASSSAPLGRTLKNATPTNSSLIARQRSSPLEAAIPIEGFRRTRPAPPKTRRTSGDTRSLGLNSDGSTSRSRQSSEEPSPRPISPWDGVLSPNMPSLDSMMEEEHDQRPSLGGGGGRSRQSSSRSTRDTSPLFSSSPNERAFNSASPLFQPKSPGLDPSPFHIMPRSPPLSQHDLSGDLSSLDETMSSLHTRPVSTASLGSESSLHEMITHLQQELSRKTAQLDAQRADGYSTILEKEALLEEVRAELGAKRREEKELRGKEKIYVSQIGTLEVQTGKYKDERDKMKLAYQNARKQYEEQCNESEKLRNTIRAKDEELRLADENVQNGNSDLAKITRERDFLQSTITRLEEELSDARLQIEVLEEQKSENLSLKETIDRLRLDLDELRAQAKLSEFEKGDGHGLRRSASGSDGLPGMISRNLGRELMRKLQSASMEDEDAAKEKEKEEEAANPDESYEEEIVTTRRRLKRPVRKAAVDTPNNANADPNAPQSVLVDVVDVSIQCDMPSLFREDMSIQTQPEPEMSPLAKRNQLARDLEVDLSAVEEFVRAKEERARLQAVVPDTAPPPYIQTNTPNWHRAIQPYAPTLANFLPHDTRSSLHLILNTTSGFLIYTLVVYLSGVLSGGALVPARHYHHITSYDSSSNWKAYNMLDIHHASNAASGGWTESLSFWLERIIWHGISISRRVPT